MGRYIEALEKLSVEIRKAMRAGLLEGIRLGVQELVRQSISGTKVEIKKEEKK